MKKLRKNLAMLIAVCMVLTMMPMMAFATDEITIDIDEDIQVEIIDQDGDIEGTTGPETVTAPVNSEIAPFDINPGDVASIDDDGYATLQAAVNAATLIGDGATVEILVDILDNAASALTIPAGADIVIDGNGKTVSGGISLLQPGAAEGLETVLTVKNLILEGTSNSSYGISSNGITGGSSKTFYDKPITAKITVDNCEFNGFNSKGVYVTNVTYLSINDTSFSANGITTGVYGRGDYVVDVNLAMPYDADREETVISFTNCTVKDNYAETAAVKVTQRGDSDDKALATDMPSDIAPSSIASLTVSGCDFTDASNHASYIADVVIGSSNKAGSTYKFDVEVKENESDVEICLRNDSLEKISLPAGSGYAKEAADVTLPAAQIDGEGYATVLEAIKAAKSGDVVELLKSETVDIDADLVIEDDITIKGFRSACTGADAALSVADPLINVKENATLTVKGDVTFTDNVARHIICSKDSTGSLEVTGSLTIKENITNTTVWNVKLSVKDAALTVSENRGIGIAAKDAVIDNSALTIEKCEYGHGFTGGMEVKNGSTVTIETNDYSGLNVEYEVKVSDTSKIIINNNKLKARSQDKDLAYIGSATATDLDVASTADVLINGYSIHDEVGVAAKSGNYEIVVDKPYTHEADAKDKIHVYVVFDKLNTTKEVELTINGGLLSDVTDYTLTAIDTANVAVTGNTVTLKTTHDNFLEYDPTVNPQIELQLTGSGDVYQIFICAAAQIDTTITNDGGAGNVAIKYTDLAERTDNRSVSGSNIVALTDDVTITAAATTGNVQTFKVAGGTIADNISINSNTAVIADDKLESTTYTVDATFYYSGGGGGGGRGGSGGSKVEEDPKNEAPADGDDKTPDKIFTDVAAGAWYADAVSYVVDQGLFAGMSDTEFGPDVSMSRAMFVTVLGKLAENMGFSTTGYANSFADVPAGEYYTNYVSWGNANGIIAGYDAVTFGTHDNVTREQMAVLFVKFADYAGIPLNTASTKTFTDVSGINAWAAAAVDAATAAGLINGYEDGSFRPQGTATRAEVATVFMNFTKAYGGAANTATDKAADDAADDGDLADETKDEETK